MDGAREYNTKQNKPVREKQIPYDLTHVCNLRNKWAKGKKKRERNKPINNTLWTRDDKQGYQGEVGGEISKED